MLTQESRKLTSSASRRRCLNRSRWLQMTCNMVFWSSSPAPLEPPFCYMSHQAPNDIRRKEPFRLRVEELLVNSSSDYCLDKLMKRIMVMRVCKNLDLKAKQVSLLPQIFENQTSCVPPMSHWRLILVSPSHLIVW